MARWSPALRSLICLDGSNEPAGPQIYPWVLTGTEPICIRPWAIPPQPNGDHSPPGVLGQVVPEMNRARVNPLPEFAQLTNITALKLSIPGLMQLNDLFPLLIAAWLTADPSIRLSSRMPGCFPARLQLIQKPLQCMNSLSGLRPSHYLALLG